MAEGAAPIRLFAPRAWLRRLKLVGVGAKNPVAGSLQSCDHVLPILEPPKIGAARRCCSLQMGFPLPLQIANASTSLTACNLFGLGQPCLTLLH